MSPPQAFLNNAPAAASVIRSGNQRRNIAMYLQFTGVGGVTAKTAMPGGAMGVPIQEYHLNVKMPMSQNPHAAAIPTGRCVFGDLTVTRYIDSNSPQFEFFCANGTRIPAITLSLAGQYGGSGKFSIYQTYKIETAFISRVAVGSTGRQGEQAAELDPDKPDLPLEVISFTYSKITWTFTPPTNKAGSPAAGVVSNLWDLMANEGG